jgi:hypothetical protein
VPRAAWAFCGLGVCVCVSGVFVWPPCVGVGGLGLSGDSPRPASMSLGPVAMRLGPVAMRLGPVGDVPWVACGAAAWGRAR